ncbi:MAG TPA: hypothetical protein VKZ48_05845 [Burkholderiales bacterium]|nr:hypothetical protein [Burkholderiales bacterium]
MKRTMVLGVAVAMLGGCSGWWPFSGPEEQSRIPRDAVVYACEGGKTLPLRVDEGGKSVMVIYPEREFRLDQRDGGRYGNGVTTLHLDDADTWLEERGNRVYQGCKRPAG